MYKHVIVIASILITSVSFSQISTEEDLMGQWQVSKVKTPKDVPQKEAVKFIVDAFTGAIFNFKGNKIFEIIYGDTADDRIKELFKINGDNWKLENEVIKIGTESNEFSSMNISVGEINGNIHFLLPMFALQVEKIKDDELQPFEASKNVNKRFNMSESETIEPKTADINSDDLVPFSIADIPPLAPECKPKWDVEKQRQCTSSYISKHVMRKFNTNLASQLNISGKVRIEIEFTIDKTGQPVNIDANGKHEELNQHAIAIIAKLPIFTPGRSNNNAVNVSYTMPLIFMVAN